MTFDGSNYLASNGDKDDDRANFTGATRDNGGGVILFVTYAIALIAVAVTSDDCGVLLSSVSRKKLQLSSTFSVSHLNNSLALRNSEMA